MKRTTPVKKRNHKRRVAEFVRCYGSHARVTAIHALWCYACGKEPAECVHTEGGGTGRKAGWETVVDIGRACHRRLHALGSVELFDAEFGTDLKARAKWLSEYRSGFRVPQLRIQGGSRG